MSFRSIARSPNQVTYQLAGAKKVQQDLAALGVLERFVPRPEDAKNLREMFAGE